MADLLLSEIYSVSGFVSGCETSGNTIGKGEQRNALRINYRRLYYVNTSQLWQHIPMIVAGTGPPIYIDLGKDEPGMVPQRREREGGIYVWNNYMVDGKAVISPIKIDSLPPGKYRLV